MSDQKQYASPPCFLHELDPEYLGIEQLEAAKVKKKPVRADEAETDKS
jgi:hypothetical protein